MSCFSVGSIGPSKWGAVRDPYRAMTTQEEEIAYKVDEIQRQIAAGI